jgi:hypothetical protein
MKTLTLSLALLLVVTACAGGSSPSGTATVPGQGAISVQIVPNPIAARRVSGETYDFPFELILRETGGRSVNITQVTATAVMPGGLAFELESWDAERIRSMGYGTSIPANGELRYRFSPRREAPEAVFGGVSARLEVEAVDDNRAATSASTTVTVTR